MCGCFRPEVAEKVVATAGSVKTKTLRGTVFLSGGVGQVQEKYEEILPNQSAVLKSDHNLRISVWPESRKQFGLDFSQNYLFHSLPQNGSSSSNKKVMSSSNCSSPRASQSKDN